jgi:hypothetical protein
MTYEEWNRKLGDLFFRRGPEENVFLCVTLETLSQASGMHDVDAAKADFVRAIKDGPTWTQIPGCQTTISKAHNCLHPDPHWKTRRERQTEKLALEGHVNWRIFEGSTAPYPPYLAYLCLLVLAWTERDDAFHGGQFYGPLNAILGLTERAAISSNQMGPRYRYKDLNFSINSLWTDLEEWSFGCGGGVCYLPPSEQFQHSYECIPKCFGLFKAQDLRKLDHLFFALDNEKLIDAGNLPPAEGFLNRILQLRTINRYLGTVCIQQLRSEEPALKLAMGTMLLAKYRSWDGTVNDQDHEDVMVFGRGARWLRFLKDGCLQSVVKLRSPKAVDKLPLEAWQEYTLRNIDAATLVWPGGASQWFQPMSYLPEDTMGDSSLECSSLGLKAVMSQRVHLVLSNRGLPWHLQGGFVEVDEIEPGMRYLLLHMGADLPVFNGSHYSKHHGLLVPQGATAWWMDVGFDVDRGQWSHTLPPLAQAPRDSGVRIKLSSPCRMMEREFKSLAGFPVTVSCNRGGLEPFIADPSQGGPATTEGRDGDWTLLASDACEVTLALKHVGDNQIVSGSNVAATFVNAESTISDREHWHSLFSDEQPTSIQPCPMVKVLLEGGSCLGDAAGELSVFLAEDPPSARLMHTSPDCSLFLDGHLIDGEARLEKVCGIKTLEAKLCALVLDAVTIELVNTPVVKIKGLSLDRDRPTIFAESVCATIYCDFAALTKLRYEIVNAKSGCGHISMPHNGVLTTAEPAGLDVGRLYEVRFSIGKTQVGSYWIQRKGRGNRQVGSDKRRPFAVNPFDAALRGLEFKR